MSAPGAGSGPEFDIATTPLRTLDPGSPEVSDLEILRGLVGDARVVCLGESVHAVTEFYLLKDRLFRYLVTERGFTAFVMESGFAEGLAVDAWVRGGPGQLVEHIREIHPLPGVVATMQASIEQATRALTARSDTTHPTRPRGPTRRIGMGVGVGVTTGVGATFVARG